MQAEPMYFEAADGARLAWYEIGQGRPVLLLHGLFSSARMNWIKFGHADAIAARGFRVVMPDFRAHGASDKPHDPAAYPPDVLVSDAQGLIAYLRLADYDLGGFSLGARTAARMMIAGARPRRAILAGMGLDGMLDPEPRAAHFRRILSGLGRWPQGSPEFMVGAFLKTTGGDPAAMMPLLDSFVASTRGEIERIATPSLVLQGHADEDNGSGRAFAELLAHGTFGEIPGGHMSCVTKPDLGLAIADFLSH